MEALTSKRDNGRRLPPKRGQIKAKIFTGLLTLVTGSTTGHPKEQSQEDGDDHHCLSPQTTPSGYSSDASR